MAADSREPLKNPASPQDRSRIYETFDNASPSPPSSPAVLPPPNANILPGGSTNTAGGRVREATMIDGIKSIRIAEVKEVHKKPCVRDALLVGIGAGFVVGGGRLIWGANSWRSMSWAIGTFCLSSAGMYEFCQRKRMLERQGMMRAVEVMERKKIEKEHEREKVRAERRRKREEEEKRKEDESRLKERRKGWGIWGSGGGG